MTLKTARPNGKTKKERLGQEIAKAVGAGLPRTIVTVDFDDAFRPRTCLEVDFPIIPINRIAKPEMSSCAARKPIYTWQKWWARRSSAVFRSILLSAVTKAPDDPSAASKQVWETFYGDMQKRNSLSHIKVADIFMGGGTTIVEALRLGMQAQGVELNPLAWFVTKNEVSLCDSDKIRRLLHDVENTVGSALAPYFECTCPRGHRGQWKSRATGMLMPADFTTLGMPFNERCQFEYSGPEILYVFWAKHGVCQRTECNHRTPVIKNQAFALKSVSIKAWLDYTCPGCKLEFDIEAESVRMAPEASLLISPTEKPFATLAYDGSACCPSCGFRVPFLRPSKATRKSVQLSLLIHPKWLVGCGSTRRDRMELDALPIDSVQDLKAWNLSRLSEIELIEVRGDIPPEAVIDGQTVRLDLTNVPKKSTFACGSCGAVQDVLEATKALGRAAPIVPFAYQGYCPDCDVAGVPYGGRFFRAYDRTDVLNASIDEWESRKLADLGDFWPKSELPYGFMTHMNNGGIPNHGYTHWWKMFTPLQLLTHSSLLKAFNDRVESHGWEAVENALGIWQRYAQHENLLCFWDEQQDCLAPSLANNNFHPKPMPVTNNPFHAFGRGNWQSSVAAYWEFRDWVEEPWDLAAASLDESDAGPKTVKVPNQDSISNASPPELLCSSASDLAHIDSGTVDLIVTDPPFGGLLHYSELSDYFYVWMRLLLKERYSSLFSSEYTPKTLEVVANRARHPDNPDAFYARLLTECWKEGHRILKPGGLLAFTFHHSEDEPWVKVLESLFDAGFYLEATFPIRGDETKGEGAKPGTFGSQTIEYDIIHVCRKRTEEPKAVSWARMRREVLAEVRQLTGLLTLHQKAGLASGDLKVIKRGKALEYFSRHYGKVFVDEGKEFSVRDALIGINQLLDEETGVGKEPPPVNAEPFTRQFLRLFDGTSQQPREQMQMLLRGTTIDPKEYEERGWCTVAQKVYHLVSPLDIAQDWYGKHRRRLTSDYDQAMVVIGASFSNSGINVTDTLSNANFRPHPALGRLLKWHTTHGATQQIRDAAAIAVQLYATWESQHQDVTQQLKLFFDDGEEG
jgi:putative DNA methylase